MFIAKITQYLRQYLHSIREETVSPSEFAKITGYSTSTVYRWIREGKIKAVRKGPYWEIPIYEVVKYLKTPIKIRINTFETMIEPQTAYEILSFDYECELIGGKTQVRTGMFGSIGFGKERNEIQLVCWSSGGALGSKYVKLDSKTLEILTYLAKSSKYIGEFINTLWIEVSNLIKKKLGK